MIKVEQIRCDKPVYVRASREAARKFMEMFHSYIYAEKKNGVVIYMPLTHGQCIEIEYT